MGRRFRYVALVFIVWPFFAEPGGAQRTPVDASPSGRRAAEYVVEHWTTEDGLPQNTITSIAQTRDGYLWLGTLGGLVRFDGVRFVVFDRESTPGLESSRILALLADRAGSLWIGTEGGGLARFDGRRFTGFSARDGLPAPTVLALLEDAAGSLWIGTEGGGLAQRKNGAFSVVDARSGLPNRPPQNVYSLVADRRGNLWIATFKGLLRLREGAFDLFTTQEGLSRDNVRVLFEDREGSLWVGTDRGLSRLKEALFHVRTKAEGLSDDAVLAVYEDGDGALWVGTSCGGLSRLKGGTFATYDAGDGLSNPCIWSLYQDHEGALWIGTRKGLNRLKDRTFTTYTKQDGLTDDFVLAIYEDREETLWIGTREGGLNRFKEGRFTAFTEQEGLASNWVRGILEDRSGSLWIATAGGLSRFDDGTFQNYTVRDGLSSNDVRALYMDPEGVLWIGTYDGGLNRFEEGLFTAYTTQEGLADNRVTVILEDDRDHLWMGGNRGIQRVNKRDLHALAAGQTERVAALLYGRSDGLRNPESTGGFQPAGWRSRDGRLWFPTVDGLAEVDPARALASDTSSLLVLIEQVLVDETPVAADARVELPKGSRNVAFRYTSTSLLSPERTRFRFKLEGIDEEWVEAGNRRNAFYRGVDPGTYVFQVTASRDGTTWGGQASSLVLYVPPYFFETRWFGALCVLGLLAAVLAAYRLNTRRLKARALTLERTVETRTRALQAEKERVEEEHQQAEEQHKIAQQALATVEEQATQLLRMDHLKSRFFANISHEFRTPLTLVIDPLERALQGDFGPLEQPFTNRLRIALQNAQRLLRLINQLLDLARLDAGSMTLSAAQENVIPFLRSIVQVFGSEAERRQITLLFTAIQDPLLLYFDRDKLEKIIFNLISNALKATPSGGKILVTAHATDDGDAENGYAEISVRDTGIGIPPEKQSHIFDRFYQIERPSAPRHAGTGIGLSLARELVELHRGAIAVASVPGFGTTFTVRLPLGKDHLAAHEITAIQERAAALTLSENYALEASPVQAGTAPPGVAPSDGQAAEGTAPLVLIVEDNADVRELIRDCLATAYRTAEASNGLDGLEKARGLHPDLIISDVVMPEMEGIAFCRLLKRDKKLRDIPLILLTARASEESRLEGLQVGADDYITKPFSTRELLTRAENLIRSRRALRDQFSQEVVLQPSGIAVPSAEAVFLERVQAAVELHLEDPHFTVGALAAEVGLSESQLKRKMRALLGQPPVEFIRTLRLERAARLLQHRAGNVGEIAFAVGFQNLPYFAKCFRERFGVPPSQYLAHQKEAAGPQDISP